MAEVDKSKVGRTIKNLRKRAEMTQLELGRAVDERTGQNLVSRWENGEELPSVEKITKLAAALRTTTDHLLTGELPPTEGETELQEFTMWLRTLKPDELTEAERSSLAALRWPPHLGVPEPEWYDDALTMLRGVERKVQRRKRGTRH